LHLYDCLRANKSLAAWGVEGRVPFLDKEFMDVAMRLNPKDKMITKEKMENGYSARHLRIIFRQVWLGGRKSNFQTVWDITGLILSVHSQLRKLQMNS